MNRYILFIAFFLSFTVFSQSTEEDKRLRTLVVLLDYISKDYAEAVDDGSIINEFEFEEMTDFAAKSISIHQDLTSEINKEGFSNLQGELNHLQQTITAKENQDKVANIAIAIKNKILALDLLSIVPNRYPSIKKGAALYKANCVSCHGENGLGDGVSGKNLQPSPSNFHEVELSALHAYNVIKLGIEGTAMAAYEQLTEKELWDLSFYVSSLKHDKLGEIKNLPKGLNLTRISQWTDREIQSFLDKSKTGITVGDVRHYQPKRPEPLNVAREYLDDSYAVFQKGDLKKAEQLALNSYLEGIELVEGIIKASSPEMVNLLEQNMIFYRKAIQKNDDSETEKYYTLLKDQIKAADELLSDEEYSFAFVYVSALSILVREALEALLIILIVISVLKPMEIRKAMAAVHFGWISAVLIGIVSWFFTDTLINMSGASRELMEGIGAGLAVVVLLFAGIWLHSHAEISKWKAFINTKIKNISESGNWVGLFIFSFIVVFREVFEVVLFLSSLNLTSAQGDSSAILWALLTTVGLIAIFTFVFQKYTKKLPIGKFFKMAYYMIAVLAVILTGKAVMAFQEAGYIPVSPINNFYQIDILGVYANIQAILAQLIVLGIIVFFHLRNNRSLKKA
jgi:high-affinity iron transporter